MFGWNGFRSMHVKPQFAARTTLSVLVLSALISAPSYAVVTACNHTGKAVSVAVAAYDRGGSVIHGWTPIEAGTCAPILTSVQSSYNYYALVRDDQGIWDNAADATNYQAVPVHSFCVSPGWSGQFNDVQYDTLPKSPDYCQYHNFFLIRTLSNQQDFSFELVPPIHR